MLALHYYPGNASMVPHILLHELKLPFELKLVDRTKGAHKSPDYLKLNPNGLIPVLQDGALVLYETAAICLHLVDTHPRGQAGAAARHGGARPLLQVADLDDQLAAGDDGPVLLPRAFGRRRQRRRRRAGAHARAAAHRRTAVAARRAARVARRAVGAGRALQRARPVCVRDGPLDARLQGPGGQAGARVAASRAVPAAHARAAGGAARVRRRKAARARTSEARRSQRAGARGAPGAA